MSMKPVIYGLCAGVIVSSAAAMMQPHKKMSKHTVGKTLRAIGDVADSVCTEMGWL